MIWFFFWIRDEKSLSVLPTGRVSNRTYGCCLSQLLVKGASGNSADMGWKQKLVFLVLKRSHLPRMSFVTCPNQHLHGIMRPGTVAASSRCVDTEDSHLGRGESELYSLDVDLKNWSLVCLFQQSIEHPRNSCSECWSWWTLLCRSQAFLFPCSKR